MSNSREEKEEHEGNDELFHCLGVYVRAGKRGSGEAGRQGGREAGLSGEFDGLCALRGLDAEEVDAGGEVLAQGPLVLLSNPYRHLSALQLLAGEVVEA